MSTNRAIRWALSGILTAAVATGCGGSAEAGADPAEDEAYQRVINVEVLPLVLHGFQERVRLTGTVEANRDLMVSAEESGVIQELLAEEGSQVSSGQPLMRIDDAILRSQVAEAEARAALAGETWERRQRLFEQDRVGSELAYLQARYEAEQADATLAMLNERLARTVIRAPIDGIFDDRPVELGSMVSPGIAVARIVQIDPVKVTAGVPERYAGDVRVGSEATVAFDVLPAETFGGRIQYVGATVNRDSRTFDAELVLPNPGGIMKPEMVANIAITRRVLEDVIVVPQQALVRVEDGFVAFVVVSGGAGGEVAEVRRVTPGPSRQNEVVVESGLAVGDRLIVLGQNQVTNGDRVQVVEVRAEADMGGGA